MSEVFQDKDSFYVLLPDSKKAVLKYRLEKGRIYILSTYTSPGYRGKGLASKLMDEAVKFAAKNKLKIVPLCSYAQHYMDRHPELRNTLENDF
jgi:predicted GNAT family acetyltransferase